MTTTENEFTIVKGERPPRQKRQRGNGTKYTRVVEGMKKLRITDYLIVAKGIPEGKLVQKVANIKHYVKKALGKRFPRRVFEYKGIPAAIRGEVGFDVIIRRVS